MGRNMLHDEELRQLSASDLLKLHVAALGELRRRGVLRTENTPTGDLAEHLFCRAFSWEPAGNSQKGFDASHGESRYQIKGRRLAKPNTSRQLSAIRSPEAFDALAGILFDRDYGVLRAAIMPRAVVDERRTFTEHTNSHKFMLTDDVWDDERVDDVTAMLRAALAEI